MSEQQAPYGSNIRIVRNTRAAAADRLKVGRPRKGEYDELARALVAWFRIGKGSGSLGVGPFYSVKERVRLRMGFPRSKAYAELPEEIRKHLRTSLSKDRQTIYYRIEKGG